MMLGKQITLNDMESVVSKSESLPPGTRGCSYLTENAVVTEVVMGVVIQYETRGSFSLLEELVNHPNFSNNRITAHLP